MYLLWLLPAVAIAHIVEEFLFPGGFTAWYRTYKQTIASSITARYLISVNILFIVLCLLPLILDRQTGIALWLSMASVIFFNALFHLRGAFKTRAYAPGVATSAIFYIPIAIYGYWYFLSHGIVPVEQAIVSSAIGVLYAFFYSYNHRRRAAKAEKGIT